MDERSGMADRQTDEHLLDAACTTEVNSVRARMFVIDQHNELGADHTDRHTAARGRPRLLL